MHLVCPECQFHSHDNRTMECPRCGADLEEPILERPTRSSAKERRQFKPRRDVKRSRRHDWADIKTREL